MYLHFVENLKVLFLFVNCSIVFYNFSRLTLKPTLAPSPRLISIAANIPDPDRVRVVFTRGKRGEYQYLVPASHQPSCLLGNCNVC